MSRLGYVVESGSPRTEGGRVSGQKGARVMPLEEPESRAATGRGNQSSVGQVELQVLDGRPVETRCQRAYSGSGGTAQRHSVQGGEGPAPGPGSRGEASEKGGRSVAQEPSGDSGQSGG